ncbi:hypothetical protein SPRG_08653 [Saprolegnia parasitica CBS 223.65]|uniref:Uncharacterized protein n=1 Tax=Saprolegnia parasitica (strain CBS 223.65) TaxID=695850 RepID=A0A067C9Z4_SAPPC|nr:hypothetical protein SPRG_08653 [Saprolegnia parasitica CBS 223.65]KDO26000.1 hypothetical protein SPRG_08653 [Saprolegnia parasitica CBS 223.65]|eukprot:XP_012203287.1 hypothetical protein SPRG_08653 [Saprolegnia parasitica CBS 223.65]
MKIACFVLGTVLLDATMTHVDAILIADGPRNRTQLRNATTVPSRPPVLRRNRTSRLHPNATGRFTLVPATSTSNHSSMVLPLNATTAVPFNASMPSHVNASSSLDHDTNATADDDVIVAPLTSTANATTNVTTASRARGTPGVAILITLTSLVVALGLF